VIGEHAKKDVCANAWGGPMEDRSDLCSATIWMRESGDQDEDR